MRYTRILASVFAVVAMLGAPVLQQSAEAQGRSGGRQANGARGDSGRATPVRRPASGGRVGLAQRSGGRVASAQRPSGRVVVAPRPGRRVAVAPRRGGVVIGAYYRPLYYSPFYSPFYGRYYDPWFPYRYGGFSQYGYGPAYGPEAALRLQVSPRTTEVFIDGYYAGTVDDFDGIFQRLRLESGEYEMTLYLPGYRTVTQRLLLQRNRTLRVKHVMEPLGPTDPPEPRPVAADPRASQELSAPAPDRGEAVPDASFGAIAVRVQPADADVLIDGERWEGPANDEALVLQVAPGPHRIEVRKDGYRGYTTQIDVRAEETTPINVSLPRQ